MKTLQINNSSTRLGTTCLICGEVVEYNEQENEQVRYGINPGPKICGECKEVILKLRK